MPELDKRRLLRRLPSIEPDEELKGVTLGFEQLSLAAALLKLADIDHEHEYQLCKAVAEHLVGEAREPEELPSEE